MGSAQAKQTFENNVLKADIPAKDVVSAFACVLDTQQFLTAYVAGRGKVVLEEGVPGSVGCVYAVYPIDLAHKYGENSRYIKFEVGSINPGARSVQINVVNALRKVPKPQLLTITIQEKGRKKKAWVNMTLTNEPDVVHMWFLLFLCLMPVVMFLVEGKRIKELDTRLQLLNDLFRNYSPNNNAVLGSDEVIPMAEKV